MIEAQRLVAAPRLLDSQRVGIDDRREALDVPDLPVLHELAGAARQPLDHVVLERAELPEVDPRLTELDAPRLRPARIFQHVGDVQQRLRRNAAPIDADPAGVDLGVDERHAQPEIRGEKGGGVAAWPAADDHKLDRIHLR